MNISDIERPMRSKAQLLSYTVINGSASMFDYFAEVNSQAEIEEHRKILTEEYSLGEGYKIQFSIRCNHGQKFKC